MRGYAAMIAATLALGGPPGAQAQLLPATAPPSAPAPDPAYETAKRAFEALPEAERRAMQDALIWTGDYKGVVDGGFGRGTRAAIIAYAKRSNLPMDGTLDAKARAALNAAAASARTAAGFAPTRDPRAGVAFSLPTKIFTKRVDTQTGSLWTSADNSARVETSVMSESQGDLAARFDRAKDSTPTRRVTYKVLRPDFYVVSGVVGPTAFYARVARGLVGGAPALRSYTISYPSAARGMDLIAIAIANSFDPFPGAAAPIAAAGQPGAAPAPPSRPASPSPSAAPQPSAALAASAIAVAADRFLSVVGKCDDAKIAGQPARLVKRDDKTGLSLFEAKVANAKPLAAPNAAPGAGALALFETSKSAASGGAPAAELTLASGEFVGTSAPRLLAPLEETSAGGAVFDRKGAFIGVIGARAAPTRVAGVVPQAAWPLILASDVGAFLAPVARPAGQAAESSGAAEIAAQARASLLPLSCLR